MYQDFYGFKKEPFHVTPDPEFLYLSPSHEEALGIIVYGVEKRMGFMAITGGVGLGKTTILRSYLQSIDRERIKPAFVFNVDVSFKNLMKTVYEELGLELPSEDISEILWHFHMALIEEFKQGNNVVLIVDEAQNMPLETLEQLRMLSNLETASEKLIQIVLVGQPELEEMLNSHALRQLRQRIAMLGKLAPLTPNESLHYIRHRLSRVTIRRNARIFSRRALKTIVKHCQGVPRAINIVCDNALITGFGYMKKPVTSRIVREVILDLEGKGRRSRLKWAPVAFGLPLLLAGFLWVFLYTGTFLSEITGGSSVAHLWNWLKRGDVTSEPRPSPSTEPVQTTHKPGQVTEPPSTSQRPPVGPTHSVMETLEEGRAQAVRPLPTEPGPAAVVPPRVSPQPSSPPQVSAGLPAEEGRQRPGVEIQGSRPEKPEAAPAVEMTHGNSAKASVEVRKPASGGPPATAGLDGSNAGRSAQAGSDLAKDKRETPPRDPDPADVVDWFIKKRAKKRP